MDRNIIKKYIDKIDKDIIQKYALKHKIELTKNELETIYNSIKNDYEEFLDSDFYVYLEKYRNELSEKVYNKIIELYERYKVFLKR